MNELALFAGAGGGILAGKRLGWRCVCAVEIEEYARAVLIARQNDGSLYPFPIWDDVCTFDGRSWRGHIDVVSGGFPCQDISAAGRGAGIEGSKSGLWVEMARIISEVRPRYAFVENSPVLTSRGLGVVLGDLAAMGFDARWGVLGAADVGAPHKRDRIWIVADSISHRRGSDARARSRSETKCQELLSEDREALPGNSAAICGNVAHAKSPRQQENVRIRERQEKPMLSGNGNVAHAKKLHSDAGDNHRKHGQGEIPEPETVVARREDAVGGSLNPTWVEWLMGFQLGWTDLKPLETHRSRSAQQKPGEF